MSKYVKNLITQELADRLKDVEALAVMNPRGINAIKTHNIRRTLHGKGLRMTVVRNALARRAVGDGKLKGFDKLLEGPSAVVYGKASISEIARTLLAAKKEDEKIELRGIFFDGEVYLGDAGMEQVSKLPTREEAIGQLVTLILSPGRNIGGALKGPGGKLGGILKAIEEKGGAPEAAATAESAAPADSAAPASA